ncbi:MAG TPA: ABC transporter substrate-binding protein, partial [Gemmatimonadaceae bacterium]|nr:ABC transporter substrate-binding protein [Gemmatimonadaceae bacterium]
LRALPAGAQTPVKIKAATGAVEEFALPYYAAQKGFFRDAGLDVDLTLIVGGGAITQALAAGAVDLAVTNSGSLASAHARGLPIYLLTPCSVFSEVQPIAHVLVPKNSAIRSAKDLAGKTIGVTTLRDMIQAAVMCWIDQHGGSAKEAKWYEIPSGEMAPALTTGRLDAVAIVEPFYTQLADKFTAIGLPYENMNGGKPFQTTGAIGYKPWVDANKDATRRFAQALLKTADWANKNSAEVTALLGQLTKVDPAVLAAYHRVTYSTSSDPRLMQPVVDAVAKYGFIPHSFPVSEMTLPA